MLLLYLFKIISGKQVFCCLFFLSTNWFQMQQEATLSPLLICGSRIVINILCALDMFSFQSTCVFNTLVTTCYVLADTSGDRIGSLSIYRQWVQCPFCCVSWEGSKKSVYLTHLQIFYCNFNSCVILKCRKTSFLKCIDCILSGTHPCQTTWHVGIIVSS